MLVGFFDFDLSGPTALAALGAMLAGLGAFLSGLAAYTIARQKRRDASRSDPARE